MDTWRVRIPVVSRVFMSWSAILTPAGYSAVSSSACTVRPVRVVVATVSTMTSWLVSGRPLTSHEVIVETVATTTRTGRTVHAELDTAEYPAGVKIADQDMKTLETTGILTRHVSIQGSP